MATKTPSKLNGLDPLFRVRLRSAIKRDGRPVTRLSIDATGSPSVLTAILETVKNAPRADTILAIARELRVSVEWLLTGQQPELEALASADPYPNRSVARSYATAIGVSVDVLARVDRMIPVGKGDPHPDEWLALYRGLDKERAFVLTKAAPRRPTR